MMNHDAMYDTASFGGGGGGGGGNKTPTVNNNNVVVEKTASEDFFCAGAGNTDSSTERVFALDYAKLRRHYTYRLWFTGIYFVFLASMITSLFSAFANNDYDDDNFSLNWTVFSFLWVGGMWWLIYRSLSRAQRTVHQQHVALTATGIRYDKHNFPDGSTFHTTIHVRFVSSFFLVCLLCLLCLFVCFGFGFLCLGEAAAPTLIILQINPPKQTDPLR
jgi:hypothetical protein